MAEVGKPGTNWKQVAPGDRKKIAPIVRHYMKSPHPFTACVRDITGKTIGGKPVTRERAERICAVVKDMGKRTTKWRPGGKVSEAGLDVDGYIESLFDEVMAPVLDAEGVTVSELAGWSQMAEAGGLLQEAPTGALAMELDADEIGDLSLLEAAASKAPLSNAKRRSGESLGSWGKRLKAGDRANERKAKTRGGKDAEFEKKHPRNRAGEWTVKQGAKGDEVRRIQRRVGAKVDGAFGPKTAAAVRAFQRKHGLKVDGIVGRQTVAAMRGNANADQITPGALTAKDRRFLSGRASGGQGRSRRSSDREPAEDDPNFDWRRHGNRRRGVILKDGSRLVVDGPTFDRLKRQGKLSPKTPKLKGD